MELLRPKQDEDRLRPKQELAVLRAENAQRTAERWGNPPSPDAPMLGVRAGKDQQLNLDMYFNSGCGSRTSGKV